MVAHRVKMVSLSETQQRKKPARQAFGLRLKSQPFLQMMMIRVSKIIGIVKNIWYQRLHDRVVFCVRYALLFRSTHRAGCWVDRDD